MALLVKLGNHTLPSIESANTISMQTYLVVHFLLEQSELAVNFTPTFANHQHQMLYAY